MATTPLTIIDRRLGVACISHKVWAKEMKHWRHTLPFVVVGVAFVVWAGWIHLSSRLEAAEQPNGARGASLNWTKEIDGKAYSIQQYDAGTYADPISTYYLTIPGYSALHEIRELNGSSVGIPREDGAQRTFTSVRIAEIGFTLPFGLDAAAVVLGFTIISIPWLLRYYNWKNNRIRPNRVAGGI